MIFKSKIVALLKIKTIQIAEKTKTEHFRKQQKLKKKQLKK